MFRYLGLRWCHQSSRTSWLCHPCGHTTRWFCPIIIWIILDGRDCVPKRLDGLRFWMVAKSCMSWYMVYPTKHPFSLWISHPFMFDYPMIYRVSTILNWQICGAGFYKHRIFFRKCLAESPANFSSRTTGFELRWAIGSARASQKGQLNATLFGLNIAARSIWVWQSSKIYSWKIYGSESQRSGFFEIFFWKNSTIYSRVDELGWLKRCETMVSGWSCFP